MIVCAFGICCQDPPRPEVSESIRACKEAGIRVIVITGDNKYTAEAICEEIGVFDDTSNISEKSLTGTDLLNLPKDEQVRFLLKDKDGRVFSRVEPAQKQTIVQILKEQGEIVAMTGTIHVHVYIYIYIYIFFFKKKNCE